MLKFPKFAIYSQTDLQAHMWLTVGGDKFIADPLRSWGPILECRRVGSPPPGVPPGEEAHDGAIRIFGVINVLSDSLRFGKAFATRRKLLSGDEGDPNHQPPSIPEPTEKSSIIFKIEIFSKHLLYDWHFIFF